MSPSRYFVAGLLAVLLAIVLIAFARQSFAQALPCSEVGKVEAALVKMGLKVDVDMKLKTQTGAVPMRLFAHPKTGVWYLIAYPTSGMACWWLTGEGYDHARLPGVPS